MEKLAERITNLSKISKSILRYGTVIVLVALIISSILLKSASSISTLNIAREFFSSNMYAFCEVIMGAIMIDMFIAKDDE